VSAPLFIGLTGGIAAGKSAALAAFGLAGAETISADTAVHELIAGPEVGALLLERWGDRVRGNDGDLDRSRIASIVFENPEELGWLEGVLHPRVRKRVAEWHFELPPETDLAVVEVPLLFESDFHEIFDATVCVVTNDEIRMERARARGHEGLEARGERQLSQDEKAARATYVVENDGTIEELNAAVAALAVEILREVGR
jgi:dephospho-CoA kinase